MIHSIAVLGGRNFGKKESKLAVSSGSPQRANFHGPLLSHLNQVSVYVHWPYCAKICPYCDFNRYLKKEIDHERMERAYLRELDHFRSLTGSKEVISIFFGGGTPSLSKPSTIGKIISAVKSHYRPATNLEVTMEANPTSVEAEKLAQFRDAGVNRLSLGVQSLDPDDLKFLGRNHSVEDAQRAIEMAQKLFPRVSFDLIYARHPNQTPTKWKTELKKALSMGVSHLSLYNLTFEPNTPFFQRLHSKGKEKLSAASEDLAADLYAVNLETCKEFGLSQYEVSNYSKPGEESLHNLHYWKVGDYVGIGPGAAGRITREGKRESFMQLKLPEKWMRAVETTSVGTQDRNTLTPKERMQEALLCGMRTPWGISRETWRRNSENGADFEMCLEMNAVNELQHEHHLLELDAVGLRPTKKGLGFLDFVLPRLLLK